MSGRPADHVFGPINRGTRYEKARRRPAPRDSLPFHSSCRTDSKFEIMKIIKTAISSPFHSPIEQYRNFEFEILAFEGGGDGGRRVDRVSSFFFLRFRGLDQKLPPSCAFFLGARDSPGTIAALSSVVVASAALSSVTDASGAVDGPAKERESERG